jgi:hypothetical protein
MSTDPDEPQVHDLLAHVAFLRSDADLTHPMPGDVWARLQVTDIAGALPAVVPIRRKRMPVKALGGLIAASVALLALSSVVFLDRDQTPDIVAGTDVSQIAEVTSSGVNYTARDLRSQVRSLLSSLGVERPETMARKATAAPVAPGADLVACLNGVRKTMGVQPLIVDRAGYETYASVIVIISLAVGEAGEPLMDVLVMDGNCSAANQVMLAHVVYAMDS